MAVIGLELQLDDDVSAGHPRPDPAVRARSGADSAPELPVSPQAPSTSPLAESIAQYDDDIAVLAENKRKAEELAGYEELLRIRPDMSLEQYRAMSSPQRAKIILKAQPQPSSQGVPQELKNSRTLEVKNSLGAHEAPEVPQDLGATSKEKSPENLIPAEKGFSVSGSRGTQKTGVMHDMLAAYERGEIEPEPVEMTLPKYLGKYARAVAEDMKLLFGLKRARCDEYPLPYAQSFGAERLSISRDDVKRARAQLVRAGVIEEAGALPILDRRRGTQFGNPTKLYRLPDMNVTSA